MPPSKNEFVKTIEKADDIIIFPSWQSSPDSITGAFALYFFLKKMQKNAVIFWNKKIPEKLSFLAKPKKIINDLSGSRDFVIIFNTEKNKIMKVETEEERKEYRIKVTPEKGSISPKDFSFVPAEFKYDLAITVGAPSLESFKKIYFENTDLFFEVPKVNIDYHSGNDNYGQVNLTDMTASSCCEIIAEIMLEKFESAINKKIAQSLLAGIVSATESFQKPTTTPQSMVMAAKLMKYEANQAEIIRYLYKTKSLSFLKLWGRVMARLNTDENRKVVWSLISNEDFVQSRATAKDIPFILEEIQKNFSEAQVFAIFYTKENGQTEAKINFQNEKIAAEICQAYNLEPSSEIEMSFKNVNLLEAEKDFLKKLKVSGK